MSEFIKIQTLDEILAEMGEPVSVNTYAKQNNANQSNANQDNSKKNNGEQKNRPANTQKTSQNLKQHQQSQKITAQKSAKPQPIDPKKSTAQKALVQKSLQTYTVQNTPISQDDSLQTAQSAQTTLVKSTHDDTQTLNITNLADAENDKLAQILANTPHETLMVNDRKDNRLRWLAFYYLSRRELSTHELRQKLLNKDQDPAAIETLLIEFAEKGYQSDERCGEMLIREAVRKGRGKRHIIESFRTARLALPRSLDEMIASAGGITHGTVLEDEEQIDWLKLAVEARTKKYGDSIPKDPKEKARQLRFLQYRGFDSDVCFAALKKRLADFDE